ncbi:lanthionine synthetase LanC family protein [Spongiactinospora sp. TRM90649]|uniref:lanthionine synthetase LanC family protein n=1 Tax=Spongiactinospora sp. TRM90649 TaxID=3031114 RepID=UPI0023F7D14B|nr:lanthionine synthetase LanC family protein [Spongiactinospora sp. TRM90649]MDF5757109.1 lanthionine synthetase LanC family protein [Spongiactinospora sp. TRM90649]
MTPDGPTWPGGSTPLEAAVLAGRWIRSAAVDEPARILSGTTRWESAGRVWRGNPDPGGQSAAAGPSHSLYAGSAGIVLFFLELAAATGDGSYLDDAGAGARHLASMAMERSVSVSGHDLTLYHGLAGIAFALAEAGWVTGEERFEAASRAAVDRIVRGVRSFRGGPGWTGDPAQSGDGGIVLALLHAAGIHGVSAYEEVAIEAAARIAELVVPGHRFGEEGCAGLPADAVTPGFLSGTAGTAFLMARLYGVTGRPVFLQAARRGAEFVRAVSTVSERCALVPHHVPHGRALHYLGFCSGSAGVARMFYELYRVTGDQGDLDWVERMAGGIVQSGAPYRQSPGYWNVSCQCCGGAGLLELFTGLWTATGREAYLAFARDVAGHLIDRATGHDGAGYRWYQAYRRLRPWEVTADTGYMVGAAGIGSALLHLHAAEAPGETARLVLLPDNPFPAIALPASRA